MDINSLFLGPKSENESFFRDMLQFMINDHISWRKYFHPDDQSLTNADADSIKLKQETLDRTRDALLELAANLQTGSVPWEQYARNGGQYHRHIQYHPIWI